MPPIIDLDLPLPPTAAQIARDMKRWALGRGEKGMANYSVYFRAEKSARTRGDARRIGTPLARALGRGL